MGRFRKKRGVTPMDMTPFIDIVFLLIIFFMVSTTFDKYGRIDIDLPSANVTTKSEDNKSIEIIIDKNENYFININGKSEPIDINNLPNILNGVKEATISGDKDLKYQIIIDTVAKVKNCGVENLGINFYE